MLGKELEVIWFLYGQIGQTMVLEGSKNQDRLLGLGIQRLSFQNRIQYVILFVTYIYSFFFSPLLDLFVTSLGERSIVVVKVKRSYLMLLVDCL